MSTIIRLIQIQSEEICGGGTKVLFRKVRTAANYLKQCCGFILALPVIVAIRLISPVILIRFGMIWRERIGHYLLNTEIYLCERDAGLHSRHVIDLFCYSSPFQCNHQLSEMWERSRLLRIWSPTSYLYAANRLLPGYERHTIETSDQDIHGLLWRFPPHISFTGQEERKGRAELESMGVPVGAKIICFHARDSRYLAETHRHDYWNYHNYRDSDIDNYLLAAEELVKRGYYLIRMGAIVEKPLRYSNQYIIDYATSYRTDFLDIYLGSRCEYMICSATGVFAIPLMFRKSIVYVNFIPFEYLPIWQSNSLVIFKKLWLKNERRFMTFGEILDSGAGKFIKSEQYARIGIEPIENTPQEIAAISLEMDERLKGTWQTTEEDEELQRRFWSLFRSSELHGAIRPRIGKDFLRQNQDLLR